MGVVMPPTNDQTYVTYKDMNRFMWSALGACLALVGSIIAATWKLSNDISEVRQDVAVIKFQIAGLVRPIALDGVKQYQIVLVEMPESADAIQVKERERHRAVLVSEELERMRSEADGVQ